jgi:hypothetical protein
MSHPRLLSPPLLLLLAVGVAPLYVAAALLQPLA